MWKLSIAFVILLSGCSHFTFNAAMCQNIASDPHAQIPEECRNYIEEEAQKAFDNTKHKKEESSDIIEFNEK